MKTLAGLMVAWRLLTGLGQSEAAKPAWALLKAGRIDEAAAAAHAAMQDDDSPELLHVLFNAEFLRGNYAAAMDHYARIPGSYSRYSSLDEPVINAYRHLGRYAEAYEFAKARGRSAGEVFVLERLAAHPFSAEFEGLAVIPFADHPLTPYFPAFDASVNGQTVVAHIDTGGTHLVMGPQRAAALGIDVRDAGSGFHGPQRVPMHQGVADSFRFGEVTLRNVPVTVLESLKGQQDFVIFGTNILEPFLTTMDYPNKRMILSPRGNDALTRKHLAMLPRPRRETPFYLWSDHYMLAEGTVGDKPAWFFVDSGLVLILPWKGGQQQAALLASRSQFSALGVESAQVKNPPIELPEIGIAGLTQDSHIGTVNDACPKNLGGVEIRALLSHGYLKAYAWTIDFDRRVYVFSGDAVRED